MIDYLSNPLMGKLHNTKRAELMGRFPTLADCPHDRFLWLHKYLDRVPSKYYSREICETFCLWLIGRDSSNRSQLLAYATGHAADISVALARLDEINAYSWHDDTLASDDVELIRLIDQRVHPAYLNLIEGVFVPLLHVAAYCSRLDREKGVEGLDAFNIVEELENSDFASATASYNHTVRNAIAHGGITYFGSDVRYKDSQRETTLRCSETVGLLDGLLDTCNALALAWSLSVLIHLADGYSLPQHCVLEELRDETQTPWWEIVAFIPAKCGTLDQLNLYAVANTRDSLKVRMSAIQTGLLAGLLAPAFGRYFINIRSPFAFPGWCAFRKDAIERFLGKSAPLPEDLLGVAENNLIFYVPRIPLPRLVGRMHTFVTAYRVLWPLHISEMRKSVGKPKIVPRNVSIHRNGWRCVLRGEVFVVDPSGEITMDVVRRHCGTIVRKAASWARKRTPHSNPARYLPLGFATLSVFRIDYRKRRLASFGLGPDLVCTIRFSGIRRIQMPDIFQAMIEVRGKRRIAWNRSWIDEICASQPKTTQSQNTAE